MLRRTINVNSPSTFPNTSSTGIKIVRDDQKSAKAALDAHKTPGQVWDQCKKQVVKLEVELLMPTKMIGKNGLHPTLRISNLREVQTPRSQDPRQMHGPAMSSKVQSCYNENATTRVRNSRRVHISAMPPQARCRHKNDATKRLRDLVEVRNMKQTKNWRRKYGYRNNRDGKTKLKLGHVRAVPSNVLCFNKREEIQWGCTLHDTENPSRMEWWKPHKVQSHRMKCWNVQGTAKRSKLPQEVTVASDRQATPLKQKLTKTKNHR